MIATLLLAAALVQPAEYWTFTVGDRWLMVDDSNSALQTTVSVKRARQGGVVIAFVKNAQGAYHGWRNENLYWYVREVGTWWAPARVDGRAPDVRIDRDTGAVRHTWYESLDNTPPSFFWPATEVEVPLEAHGLFRFRTDGLWSAPLSWTVRITEDAPEVLLVRYDEEYPGSTGVHEDWLVQRGVGLVQIKQWSDAERSVLLRSLSRKEVTQ